MEFFTSLLLRLLILLFNNFNDRMSWLLRKILRCSMYVFSWFVIPYSFYVTYKIRPKKLTPPENDLLRIPAVRLAYLIRNGEVKSEDVVQAYIDRCNEVNLFINAIVEPRFELALKEARQIDEEILKGLKTISQMEVETPLLGVPVSVKESLAVAGMSNQAGRLLKNKNVAKEDCPAVAQVKKHGAIVLLVSNTPELCLCWETYNKVTGLTKNPHNLKRSVAGSSGGEAALIASGASLMGITTDIAGSSRLPASFVGVFGHKPTPHMVSPLGHMPCSPDPCWGDFFTPGVMCRYASDLPLLLDCIRDKNGPSVELFKNVDLQKMNFYFMENDGPSGLTQPIHRDIQQAMRKVFTAFHAEEHKFDLMKWALEVSMCKMLSIKDVDTIYTLSKDGEPPKKLNTEFFKYLCGRSKSDFPAVMIGVFQNIMAKMVPEARKKFLNKKAEQMKKEFIDLLGDNGVFFYPDFPNTAHKHFEIFHKLVDTSYMMIFNALGLPSTSCPIGVDKNNMPIGIQVVAAPGNDHLIFAVAKEIERQFGGWTEPPYEMRPYVKA